MLILTSPAGLQVLMEPVSKSWSVYKALAIPKDAVLDDCLCALRLATYSLLVRGSWKSCLDSPLLLSVHQQALPTGQHFIPTVTL